MKKYLIVYSTTDGQTLKICERIAGILSSKFNTKIVSIEDMKDLDINHYENILIGASIRYGKHKPELYSFIKENLCFLTKVKASFFSVNVVARKSEKNKPETNPYIQKFLTLSNWTPLHIGVFAGKIDYPKYRFIDRFMIRLIMWITNGPTDTKNAYEFTNWDAVDEFAKKISV